MTTTPYFSVIITHGPKPNIFSSCTCPERYRDKKNKILSNLNTTQKKSNVDVNFAIHRTDLGAHCKEITLVSKKRGEKKSMLLKKLFEMDTSETSAKQAPQALKEPKESLVQKLENTEQKHLNEIVNETKM
jgi:hypothetical protein